jgi:hypothetical protein
MSAPAMSLARSFGSAAVLVGLLAACGGEKKDVSTKESAPAIPPQQFATAEEAAAALIAAAEKFDVAVLKTILGSEGEPLVDSGDSVQDRSDANTFASLAKMQMRLEYDSTKTSAVIVAGSGEWPMPIPLVSRDGKWSFDAATGAEEVLARRIGRNELDAIQVCQGYVEAQREYALTKHDGARVHQYAQRIVSTPGKQDGLAWQAADGTWQGPVGEGIARVIAEGYSDRYQPYHGYYFKILKGQGPNAPMGPMDFVVDGAMIGGFALVAAPVEYFVSGVKTFVVGHHGVVYEKDFGDSTFARFNSMERYDPDSTWAALPAM